MTYQSPLHEYWPLTRAMLIVDADASTVAKACFDFHRSRYIHPGDKLTKYTLSEFPCTSLSDVLQRLLPINIQGKFLVLPAKNATVIIQNNAEAMAVDVINRLKVKSYLVRCDGQLSDKLPNKRHWGLYLCKKGSTINEFMAGVNPPEKRALAPHEIKGKISAAKVFGFAAVPQPFTDAHVLEAVYHLGYPIHDPQFYLTSPKTTGFEIARINNPAQPAMKEISLSEAKTQWLKKGTLLQKT